MTEQEQDAMLAAMVREQRAKRRELACLREKARAFGLALDDARNMMWGANAESVDEAAVARLEPYPAKEEVEKVYRGVIEAKRRLAELERSIRDAS